MFTKKPSSPEGCCCSAARSQKKSANEGGQVSALETAWNHALEVKDTKALDLRLADTMDALESDGSFSTKNEYLASIKAADFQPPQAVNESKNVQV